MSALISILLGLVSILFVLQNLEAPLQNLYDENAMFIVIGGTLAIAASTIPWSIGVEIVSYLADAFVAPLQSNKKIAVTCLNYLSSTQANARHSNPLRGHAKELLDDAYELTSLQFKPEKVSAILKRKIETRHQRQTKFALAIKGLAKYPPAFGLAGTVFGLIALMQKISNAQIDGSIGVEMAIALLATLYGIIVSNTLISPVGEFLMRRAQNSKLQSQLILLTINAMNEGSTLVELQEELNANLGPNERIDLFKANSMST